MKVTRANCAAPIVGLLWLTSAACIGASATRPGFILVSQAIKTVPVAQVGAASPSSRAVVSKDKKSLTFSQKTIRLVATTGPEDDMLSYRIDGLRNPTLVLPKGAIIRLLFINTDDDMFHNIRFGSLMKTWPNSMEAAANGSVGTPPIPHKTEKLAHAEALSVRAPSTPGTYAYFCTVRGHAQGGMWGKVEVR